MEADVWAINKAGDRRRFTKLNWDLLGPVDKDGLKEGFKLMEDHIIHNVVSPKTVIKPTTGEKQKANQTQTMDNALKNDPAKEVKTESNSNALDKTPGANSESKTETTDNGDKENLEKFVKAAEGIKRGDIKDFFDKLNDDAAAKELPPVVEYKNTENTYALTLKLAAYFKNDVIEFQKTFSN